MEVVKAQPLAPDRYTAASGVLTRVLVLNLGVALAKIAFGYASGAISILSDGFHSLTDAASNIVGLVGIRAGSAPLDRAPAQRTTAPNKREKKPVAFRICGGCHNPALSP